MSSIHFKFRSGADFEPLFFDGHCISLKEFRESVILKKKMSRSQDFKLKVTDSTTEYEYTNDNEMIHKNTAVIIRRVPLHFDKADGLTVEEAEKKRAEDLAKISNLADCAASETLKLEAAAIQSSMVNDESESTILPGQLSKVPICYHCKKIGHVYKNCPVMPKNASQGKEPVHLFLRSQLGLPVETPTPVQTSTKKITAVKNTPDSLICSLCHELMKNAVLIPCCGTSFCESCIQNYLIDHEMLCPFCNKPSKPENMVSNLSLRKSILDFENSKNTIVEVTENQPTQSMDSATANKILAAKVPNLLTLNNMSNLNIFGSKNLPNINLLKQKLTPQIIPPINSFNSKIKNAHSNMIQVHAPYLTQNYARSVISGERILTVDEFDSLKSAIKSELKYLKSDQSPKRSKRSNSRKKSSKSPVRSSSRSSRESRRKRSIDRERRRERNRKNSSERNRERRHYRRSPSPINHRYRRSSRERYYRR